MSTNKKKEKKTPQQKATISGAAVAAAGAALLFGIGHFFPGILIVAVVAFGIGKLVGTMSTPLDLTTHNKQDEIRQTNDREIADLDKESTGDAFADDVIQKGKEALHDIREANADIRDPELTADLYQLETKCLQIFKTIREKPAKAPQVRKFMNYYLPTTQKMLNSYRVMQNRGVSESEMVKHRAAIHRGMGMVNTACQKQLDNLFKETLLDVSTDIDVLEQMLRRDGFVDGELSEGSINEAARTAAAATLAGSDVPTLTVPDLDHLTGRPRHQSSATSKE